MTAKSVSSYFPTNSSHSTPAGWESEAGARDVEELESECLSTPRGSGSAFLCALSFFSFLFLFFFPVLSSPCPFPPAAAFACSFPRVSKSPRLNSLSYSLMQTWFQGCSCAFKGESSSKRVVWALCVMWGGTKGKADQGFSRSFVVWAF